MTDEPLTESSAIRRRLIELHDQDGLSWRQIADLPEFSDLKAGTLCSFAKGDYEPKDNDIRRRLGLTEIVTVEVKRNRLGRFEKRD